MLTEWEIPTFRGIAEDPTILGIPKRHAGLVIILGLMPPAILSWWNDTPLAAVGLACITLPSLLFVFRWLYKRDPHWAEHLTWHRYPRGTWLGE